MELNRKGLLHDVHWQHEDWNELMDLLNNPKEHILKCTVKAQEGLFMRRGFLSTLKKASHFYLYGAGKVAEKMLAVLSTEKLHSDGILVSSVIGNPSSVDGVPVYALDASPADKDKDLVIIAVTPSKPDAQQEIFSTLDGAGYKGIIVITEKLQNIINNV